MFAMVYSKRIRLNFPISAFYPHFSVLSPFQRFIPISAFYPHFSVLSPFQRFIPISAFYPHFSVLSPFQRFIPISAFYPHFSFRFQFPRFSFSVLSLPIQHGGRQLQSAHFRLHSEPPDALSSLSVYQWVQPGYMTEGETLGTRLPGYSENQIAIWSISIFLNFCDVKIRHKSDHPYKPLI